jgi:hypothetical protein
MGMTPVSKLDSPLISWETKQPSIIAFNHLVWLDVSVKQKQMMEIFMICVPLSHAFLPKNSMLSTILGMA